MRPPVFLTGATGFLGMEVLARLLEQGDREVIALVRARDNAEAAARLDGILGRLWRDPAPVAAAILFLLSDMARAITGEILHVDGGFHAMGTAPVQVMEEATA